MQILNKVERIAHLQGKNCYERQNAIQDMLVAYRSTPHPATGVAPYDAMRGCIIRMKLDHVEPKKGTWKVTTKPEVRMQRTNKR